MQPLNTTPTAPSYPGAMVPGARVEQMHVAGACGQGEVVLHPRSGLAVAGDIQQLASDLLLQGGENESAERAGKSGDGRGLTRGERANTLLERPEAFRGFQK